MDFVTTNRDPMAELYADPEFVDAYLKVLSAEYESREYAGDFAEYEDATAARGTDLSVLDEAPLPGLELEEVVRYTRVAAARRDERFHNILTAAARDAERWVDIEGRLPALVGARGMSASQAVAHCRDIAVDAAVLDIAARTQMTDGQVHAHAHRAQVLHERCPKLWAAYLAGDVPEQNAAKAATVVDSLPVDPDAWAAFDEQIVEAATRLTTGKFDRRARQIRERVHPESIEERHARAAEDRDVWTTPELDGMGMLSARITAVDLHIIDENLDQAARALRALPGETRTLAQLRADVFADILRNPSQYAFLQPASEESDRAGACEKMDAGERPTGEDEDVEATSLADCTADLDAVETVNGEAGTEKHRDVLPLLKGITPVVRITIPALSILGLSDEPATLDGYGPIDMNTAKRLAAGATSWIRVVTHPITGTVLDVDRKVYRVPTDLRRWLDAQHTTCIGPGCNRPARLCDIDHRQRWADGGKTSSDNLGPLCERHHKIKDESRWQLIREASGALCWRSPTGHTTCVDPPVRARPVDPTLLHTIFDPAESEEDARRAAAVAAVTAQAASTAKYDGPPPF
ncbi:DUF222 domain-containing protein [Microbacterium sp. MC2]